METGSNLFNLTSAMAALLMAGLSAALLRCVLALRRMVGVPEDECQPAVWHSGAAERPGKPARSSVR